MTRFEKLVYWHGRISDSNAVWFPFVFLKPQPHEEITAGRRLSMTFCFGLYASLVWPLKQWLLQESFDWRGWGQFTLKALVFFTLWFRLVTVPLWNRRAKTM